MFEQAPLPQGFRAAGVTCGIKTSGRQDLAAFVSDVPATGAGVFTQNRVCGAPVVVCRERLPRATARGVVINAGNANACTGARGIEDAREMAALMATPLACEPEDVAVFSTGIIGHFLPMEKVRTGIAAAAAALNADSDALVNAAKAIMTTDTVHKLATRTANIDGTDVRVTGVAKGAAMIAPNMATMLCVVMTDACLDPEFAQATIKSAVDDSFNCISVEGHTSTSDSVVLLANGASGVSADDETARMIREVTQELAQAIIRDAEGAEHFIQIDVEGARDAAEAKTIAKCVADSPLVKTAITGADPNWGRIVSAAGYAGIDFNEQELSLKLNDVPLYIHGVPQGFDEAHVSQSIRDSYDVRILLQLTRGEGKAKFWTCDLTAEYIRLNSEYTT